MGTDHGKKIKTPLRKPKVIDEIGKKKEPVFGSIEEFRKATGVKKQSQTQTQKPAVRNALKKNKKAGESSKKTTITDTQKRGQLGLRYDLFEGRRLPKEPTKKKASPGSKNRKQSRNPKRLPRNTEFLPHIIKPLYMFPEDDKPKFLRKKTSGSA
tara:strand:- start:15 stop:479 length:465 start_codon:yes stop_codon:yes gene_type:complete